MAKARRAFSPESVAELSKASIKAVIGVGAVVWKYTVLVPVEETKPGSDSQQIATDEDLENIEHLLTNDFNGLTILADSVGYGLREGQVELNKHKPFVVYTAPITPSEIYFQTLRKELENALVQEAILVERQEVWVH